MGDKEAPHDKLSQGEALVSPKLLRWLPVSLGSAADLSGLITLLAQKWVGATIFGAVGLALGVAQIVRYRGHLVGRAVLAAVAAVAAVAIGGVTFGFAVDRLIVAARDGSPVGQTVTGPAGEPTTSAPPALAPVSTPEAATTKSLLDVPSIGSTYERSPQTVSGTYEERVLSRKIFCESATSEEFQLDGKFRVFRAHVGLTDQSHSQTEVTFVVRVDGEDRGSTTLSLGQLQLVNIQVSGGSQLELHVKTGLLSCEGSARAAWVNPVVTQ